MKSVTRSMQNEKYLKAEAVLSKAIEIYHWLTFKKIVENIFLLWKWNV